MSRERTIITTCAASMTPRRVRWLWRDRLPRGMFSLLAGREGIGKSCLAIDLIAGVTTGEVIGDLHGSPAPVLYMAAEDSWEHTVVPRLRAARADLSLVHQVRVQEGAAISDPSLPTDIAALEERIRELGVRLVVLDPIISRLDDGLDTHKDRDVRRALEPLAGLAERTGAAVVGIMHVSKADTTDALTSMMGSRAFAATARAVLFAVRDGDTNLLGFPKSNLGPPQPTLSYAIESVNVGSDPDDGQPITAGAVKWTGKSDRRVQDVLADQASGPSKSNRDRAKAWLRDALSNGPVAAGELKARADAAGFKEKTLSRAADALNVVKARQGFQGGSTWALPDVEAARPPVEGGATPGGDPSATTESSDGAHSDQPSRAGLGGLDDLNGSNDQGPAPHSCQQPPPGTNDLNGLNAESEEPPDLHSRHSGQSGHAGGGEIGDLSGPGEAGPEAATPAGPPSEPGPLGADLLHWLDAAHAPAAVKA